MVYNVTQKYKINCMPKSANLSDIILMSPTACPNQYIFTTVVIVATKPAIAPIMKM